MTEASKDTLYCGFCGKSQHEVRKLIAGPISFICNECVALCAELCEVEVTQARRRWALKQAIKVLGKNADNRNVLFDYAKSFDDFETERLKGFEAKAGST